MKEESAGPVKFMCHCCSLEIHEVDDGGGHPFYELLLWESEGGENDQAGWSWRYRIRNALRALKGKPYCKKDNVLSKESCIQLYEELGTLLGVGKS